MCTQYTSNDAFPISTSGLNPISPAPHRHHAYPKKQITSSTPTRIRNQFGLVCQKSYAAYIRTGSESNHHPAANNATPSSPNHAITEASRCCACAVDSTNPIARPANPNAAQGKIGNSHVCGTPKICTPFTYDSSHHGSHVGRAVVHSGGVANAIDSAAAIAAPTFQSRQRAAIAPLCSPLQLTIQQTMAISTSVTAITFKMSTRSRSVHGAWKKLRTYSCKRNSSANKKISPPRRIELLAIAFAFIPFARIRSVVNASDTPARNKNSGAGSVPPSCEY